MRMCATIIIFMCAGCVRAELLVGCVVAGDFADFAGRAATTSTLLKAEAEARRRCANMQIVFYNYMVHTCPSYLSPQRTEGEMIGDSFGRSSKSTPENRD